MNVNQAKALTGKENIQNRIIQVGGLRNNNGCYTAGVSSRNQKAGKDNSHGM